MLVPLAGKQLLSVLNQVKKVDPPAFDCLKKVQIGNHGITAIAQEVNDPFKLRRWQRVGFEEHGRAIPLIVLAIVNVGGEVLDQLKRSGFRAKPVKGFGDQILCPGMSGLGESRS